MYKGSGQKKGSTPPVHRGHYYKIIRTAYTL